MSERKLSAVEVLGLVLKRVERIESDAQTVKNAISLMIEKQRRQGEPVSGKGPSPVAAPGAS